MSELLKYIDPEKKPAERQAWRDKYKYLGVSGVLLFTPQISTQLKDAPFNYKTEAKVVDIYNNTVATVGISENGVKSNFTASCITELESLYNFVVEVSEAYKDKKDLNVWEAGIKTSALYILDRINNRKNLKKC